MNTPPRSVVLTTVIMIVVTGTSLVAIGKTSPPTTIVLAALALLSQIATGVALHRWMFPRARDL